MKPSQRRLVDACLFCGATGGLTKEHLWPEWLRRALPDLGPGVHTIGVAGYPHTFERRRRPAFTVARKIVCAACNNGWMAALEQRAQPLLTPMVRGERSITLSPDDQATVALWFVKTAMTTQWASAKHRHPGIPLKHYRALYETGAPPSTAHMWIFACSHEDRPLGTPAEPARSRIARLTKYRPTAVPADQPDRPGWAATLAIGNVGAHMVAHGYEGVSVSPTYEGGPTAGLQPIWPPHGTPVTWPQPPAFDYAAVVALTWSVGPLI
jgi:hypothetical protein